MVIVDASSLLEASAVAHTRIQMRILRPFGQKERVICPCKIKALVFHLLIEEDHEHLAEVTGVGDDVCLPPVKIDIGCFNRSYKRFERMSICRVIPSEGFVVLVRRKLAFLGQGMESWRNT